jgi:hypothetical protein
MTAGTSALLIAIGGGAAGIAALTSDRKDAPRIVTAVGQAAQDAPPAGHAGDEPAPQRSAARAEYDEAATAPRAPDGTGRARARTPRHADAAPEADVPAPARTTGPAAVAVPPAAVSAQPARTTRTEVETREIPFQTRLVRDASLPHGSKRVQTPGVPGEETLRYLVTVTDGQVTDRRLLDATVTRRPRHRVVAFGARRTTGHQPDRDCRRALTVCIPLGRSQVCPDDQKPDLKHRKHGPSQENVLHLGGSVVVLDQDLELLDAETLDLAIPAC